MEFKVGALDPAAARRGFLAVPLWDGDKGKGPVAAPPSLSKLPKVTEIVARALQRKLAGGGKGEVTAIPGPGDLTLLLAGLGRPAKADLETFRVAAAATGRRAARLGAAGLTSLLHDVQDTHLGPDARVAATVEGFVLGAYRFDRFRSVPAKKDRDPPIRRVHVVVAAARDAAVLKPTVARARILAESQSLARDIGNLPANVATPRHVADLARRLARSHGLRIRVLGPADMRRLGMHGILGVNQGSDEPPRLVVLEHRPPRARGKPYASVALVGKGVTFDSGGISLKPGPSMELMKYDKSGACAVLATLVAVARLKLPVHVLGIAALTENMPSGSALKPGDILAMASKKTVEILNTDAEGRLILADALWFAAKTKPAAIIDIATLTGAIETALGKHYTGVFTPNDTLAGRLHDAGESSGERIWRMPLGDPYQEQIKGAHADLVNIGGKSGGASTAAQFLSNFVDGDKTAWAHLDIAATAWVESDGPYTPKGVTGVGVRLLTTFLARLGEG